MPQWLYWVVVFNGGYDLLCAIVLLQDRGGPHSSMFEPMPTEDERILMAHYVLLYGAVRFCFLSERAVTLSYISEALFFGHLALIGRVIQWRAVTVVLASLALAVANVT